MCFVVLLERTHFASCLAWHCDLRCDLIFSFANELGVKLVPLPFTIQAIERLKAFSRFCAREKLSNKRAGRVEMAGGLGTGGWIEQVLIQKHGVAWLKVHVAKQPKEI